MIVCDQGWQKLIGQLDLEAYFRCTHGWQLSQQLHVGRVKAWNTICRALLRSVGVCLDAVLGLGCKAYP